MKIYIETYGCTANLSDSQGIRNAVMADGGTITEDPGEADTVIVNTCAVTEFTSKSMVRAIRKFAGKKIIVAGCMAAAQPHALNGFGPGVVCVDAPGPAPVLKLLGLRPAGGAPLLKDRTAIISIAEGCRGHCSYCIVRQVRGPLRSIPVANILCSLETAVRQGAKEIFLTAQDTGAYGMDNGIRLPGLMRRILQCEGDFKIRLGMMNTSSIADILTEMIDVFNDQRVYRFAHIPIQSGSDRILSLMNRPYTVKQYGGIVGKLRESVPDITLSTDYIVGFPTESDGDFAQTMDDLRANKPLKVNITRFSSRPGTPAATMKDLPLRIKKERSRALTLLHHDITSSYMRNSIGRRLDVLVTGEGKPGTAVARDDAYHMIVIPQAIPPGARLQVKICGASTTYMYGELIEK